MGKKPMIRASPEAVGVCVHRPTGPGSGQEALALLEVGEHLAFDAGVYDIHIHIYIYIYLSLSLCIYICR